MSPYLPNFTQIAFYLHAKSQENFDKNFKKKIKVFFSDRRPSGWPDKVTVGEISEVLQDLPIKQGPKRVKG